MCYVFSVFIYGCELWISKEPHKTPLMEMMDKIEACEMWFLRRMGKISWKQKMKNGDVLTQKKSQLTVKISLRLKLISYLLEILTYNHPPILKIDHLHTSTILLSIFLSLFSTLSTLLYVWDWFFEDSSVAVFEHTNMKILYIKIKTIVNRQQIELVNNKKEM